MFKHFHSVGTLASQLVSYLCEDNLARKIYGKNNEISPSFLV